MNISDIFDYLFTTFGKVTTAQVKEAEQKILEAPLDLRIPLETLWSRIDDLKDLSDQANSPYTQKQCINIAYILILSTKKFKDYIMQWNRRPHVQQTWMNFKSDFTAAQNELKEYGALTMEDSELHCANIVSDVIRGWCRESLTRKT